MVAEFHDLIGEGTELNSMNIAIRAFLVFIIALILLRLAGHRAFGMGAAFDNVMMILLGAILSRAVTGASPFIPTIVGTIVIVALYRLFAWLSVKSGAFGQLIKGSAKLIYHKGNMHKEKMDEGLVTERDLLERVHYEAHVDSIEEIDKAYLERNGSISIITKKKDEKV